MTTSEPISNATVTQSIDAPPERLFDAWLDPAVLGRWMFGPSVRDEEIVRLVTDPHVGGHFSFVVRRDGDELEHLGRYLELDRPRRLAFTWGVAPASDEDSRVEVDIRAPAADGSTSQITVTHHLHPDWAPHAARIEEGWGRMLGALAAAMTGEGVGATSAR
ncbi:MAG: SRPBCC domain-containing protein [Deltaproteobacteria bacterium]|nr:SRPBCC domain-containing protein [Deltaproteobacteria bacterium]